MKKHDCNKCADRGWYKVNGNVVRCNTICSHYKQIEEENRKEREARTAFRKSLEPISKKKGKYI